MKHPPPRPCLLLAFPISALCSFPCRYCLSCCVSPSHLSLSGLLMALSSRDCWARVGPEPTQLKLTDPPKASSNSHFFHFPGVGVIFFPSLFHSQTLIFLAENRKPYQIGITVLFAVGFFPQRLDEFGLRQKAICCVCTDLFGARKRKWGRRKPWLLILMQRAVACQVQLLKRKLTTASVCVLGT